MHAVACVKDGDRGRTLRSCALWRALVEFYGEGKGGSNPEGEVVEDEVRGPTVWSVSVRSQRDQNAGDRGVFHFRSVRVCHAVQKPPFRLCSLGLDLCPRPCPAMVRARPRLSVPLCPS